MAPLPSRLVRLLPPLLLLLSSTSALNFTIQSINCTQLDWSLTLSQPEWSVASYVDLFFVSTTGGQNYSVLYSAFNGGDFPGPGSYSMVTNFGDTRLSGGGYRIGAGLADGNGNLLTTTSGGGLVQQVTSVDGRLFSADCGSATNRGAAAGVTSTATSGATQTSMASSSLVTSTSSTSAASATSTASTSAAAAAAAATNLASSASTSTTSSSHGINKPALAAGLVCGLLFLVLAFFLVRFCTSRRRTRAAAHRLSALRPLELCEKQPAGFLSPRATDEKAVSRDTLDTAGVARLSESSRPYGAGAYSARSGSLNNVLSEFPQNHGASHDWVGAQTPGRKPTISDDLPTYPQRSSPAPLVISLPSRTISPLTSPTRSVRPSPSTSHFRIPRVSVPSYTADGGGQVSRSSSVRRLSTGGMTAISMDGEDGEDPFVDAAQEPQEEEVVVVHGRALV